jgi:hypothetical protein
MNRVQIILQNKYGRFYGQKHLLTDDQLESIKEASKLFYRSGFELTREDGSFMVFPPKLVSKSILYIESEKINDV